jgi:predicted dehydrogenase
MRAAVVGLGRMGCRHIEVARKLGIEVAGVADANASVARDALQRYGLDRKTWFASGATLLAEMRPDIAVIATTAPAHCELVCAAAEAGVRHILCEKPMAVSAVQAERMIAACEASGARLAVNHQMRFMAQYTEVKRLAGDPELGGLVSMLVSGSNFGLAMNGSHYFEAFRFVTGEEIEQVTAWFDDEIVPNPRGAQFEDRAGRLLATSASGWAMYMDFSSRAGHGLQVTYVCRHGQIAVDELSGYVRTVAREPQYRDLPATRYGMPAAETVTRIEPADVVGPTAAVWEALIADTDFPDGAAGLHALRCLVAAHRSVELGHVPVRLDDPEIGRERTFPWA